jgi:predicted DsbA family dithiol-disulfide isomerase
MPIRVDIYSDYVCPYCVLFGAVLDAAAHDLDVEIAWKPVELRPYPAPTLRPEDDYLPSVWKSSVYPLAQALDVPLKLPSVSPQPYSRLAHEGARFAALAGKADEYHVRVFSAFFEDDRDIGDLDVLTSVAGEVGLAPDEFRAALVSGRFTSAHEDALQEAGRLGIHSVPSVFINSRPMALTYDVDSLRAQLRSNEFMGSE